MVPKLLILLTFVIITSAERDEVKKGKFLAAITTEAPEESVCFSSECVLVASRLRSWMDTVNSRPCDNFYNYACGGFLADTCLNESEVKVTPFTMLNDFVGQQLVKVLEEPTITDNELAPFKLFKSMFAKCNSDKGEKIFMKCT